MEERVDNLTIKPKKYWGLVGLYDSELERGGNHTGGMFENAQINYHGDSNY